MLVRHTTVSRTEGTLWKLCGDSREDACLNLKPHFNNIKFITGPMRLEYLGIGRDLLILPCIKLFMAEVGSDYMFCAGG
ncbi:Dihydropyrimidine dehydrogenase [Dirofilaria immitis]